MKSKELLERLRRKAVFSIQDVERVAGCDRSYAKQVLARLKKRKMVKAVKRNAYTTKDNIFIIASNITYPSYISFWSASNFLGYTEQIVSEVKVATTRWAKPVVFEGHIIKFIPLKQFFGYRKIRTEDGEILIADNEKLLIDAFLKPRESGNFDEIEKMFEKATVSGEKIVEYLKMVNSQTVTKRVGFMLEKMKGIDIRGSFSLDSNYVALNPLSRTWKNLNSKWRLKV